MKVGDIISNCENTIKQFYKIIETNGDLHCVVMDVIVDKRERINGSLFLEHIHLQKTNYVVIMQPNKYIDVVNPDTDMTRTIIDIMN